MRCNVLRTVLGVFLASVPWALCALAGCGGEAVQAPARLVVDDPLDGSVFPPDFTAPTFLWHDPHPDARTWRVTVVAQGDAPPVEVTVAGEAPPRGEIDPDCLGPTNEPYEPTPYQASARAWTPDATLWAAIKRCGARGPAAVVFRGLAGDGRVVSEGRTHILTSSDPVGAPILYRDVPLMPARGEAGKIKPLSANALPLIAWRLRDVARRESRVLLRGMPSCANCHSFSRDGRTLGMDVDGPTGDKGAYALVDIEPHTTIRDEDVITWNAFPDKPEGHRTIGFLSRVSPDGRHVVTTLNEELYVANFLDHRFLQVFYPTRGILAVHDRERGTMRALPGADDPAYVHCDPVWTPDGKHLVFARARARDAYIPGRPLATRPNDPNETPIQYDLVRMPFADGRGGSPQPIEGASGNGMSNTFPKVSPDGKWIVFVKCRNGQLMRPDGRLWIVPAGGGVAREMTCNTRLMNSWHSFSPNGRWMVFASKANTPYTQLFLTHIDEHGNDSPAILLPGSTAANRAANLPEFLNAPYDALQSIEVPAVRHHLELQHGLGALERGDFDAALAHFERALEKEPDFARAHVNLGRILAERGKLDEALQHYERALEINPGIPMAHVNLGFARELQGRHEEARAAYRRALAIDARHVLANNNLGHALLRAGRLDEALRHLRAAVAADPTHVRARRNLAWALLRRPATHGEAREQFLRLLEQVPDDIAAHANLSRLYLAAGDRAAGVRHLRRVVELDARDRRAVEALAWQLATAPEDDVRDGRRAVELMQAALRAPGARTPRMLDVLAAAQAESGDFDEAVKTAQEALERLAPDADLTARVRARLAGYRAGRPYRSPPGQ